MWLTAVFTLLVLGGLGDTWSVMASFSGDTGSSGAVAAPKARRHLPNPPGLISRRQKRAMREEAEVAAASSDASLGSLPEGVQDAGTVQPSQASVSLASSSFVGTEPHLLPSPALQQPGAPGLLDPYGYISLSQLLAMPRFQPQFLPIPPQTRSDPGCSEEQLLLSEELTERLCTEELCCHELRTGELALRREVSDEQEYASTLHSELQSSDAALDLLEQELWDSQFQLANSRCEHSADVTGLQSALATRDDAVARARAHCTSMESGLVESQSALELVTRAHASLECEFKICREELVESRTIQASVDQRSDEVEANLARNASRLCELESQLEAREQLLLSFTQTALASPRSSDAQNTELRDEVFADRLGGLPSQ